MLFFATTVNYLDRQVLSLTWDECGLDCENCAARIATVNNDDELREKTAKEWSVLNLSLIHI